MTTFVGSSEAARRLGVSTATLYAYVSRGRVARRRGADGRTSLFAVDEIERLAATGRRPPGPRSTIDVRISSAVTALGEGEVIVRGHDLCRLARSRSFEAIAELLWTSALPSEDPAWRPSSPAERRLLDDVIGMPLDPIARLAVGAHLLGTAHGDDGSTDAARRLLVNAPGLLGSTRRTGPFAHRLVCAWIRRPDADAVRAVDTALGLLADHELATSTLAVRVAASVRASPYSCMAAGLATVQGPLHGAAAEDAAHFLDMCAHDGVDAVVARLRRERAVVPGFGHKVYRGPDPRFEVLMDAVRDLGDTGLEDHVVREVGRVLPQHPNVDFALAALIRRLGLPSGAPLFAVARIAGWAAHHSEELDEAPIRYRGVSS